MDTDFQEFFQSAARKERDGEKKRWEMLRMHWQLATEKGLATRARMKAGARMAMEQKNWQAIGRHVVKAT